MKKRVMILTLILALVIQVLPLASYADDNTVRPLRGIWVASVINLDYPSAPSTSAEQLKKEAIEMLDRIQSIGFNAVFLQVRPTGDALYKSDIFPWSQYLTGTQGVAPSDDFDPLAFWVEEAHKRNIQIHAWINPYRITKRKNGDPAMTVDMLSSNNPARRNPEWVISHGKGDLYYDPGLPEVRTLIISGIEEIVNKYNVDGIHFDDYFYPGKDFKDDASYAQYGAGMTKDDWRRHNVNQMVKGVQSAIKAINKDVSFGISPFGIWANKSDSKYGSNTKGNQSYFSHYADSLKWVKEEMIDYIVPQIYWHIGFNIADYATLLDWWTDAVSGTNVALYIGQAAYRTGNSSASSPWYGNDQLFKQLSLNLTKPEVKGSIFFREGSFAKNESLTNEMKSHYKMLDNAQYHTDLSVNNPTKNITTRMNTYYISGHAHPFLPLYMNGKPVAFRSPKGYFGISVPLVKGDNHFVFTQGEKKDSINIYRGWRQSSSSQPSKPIPLAIPQSSAYPRLEEYHHSGDKLRLSCRAPIGSDVTVKIGNKVMTLKASSTAKTDKVTLTTFSGTYTLPKVSNDKQSLNLKNPVYTMTYKGVKNSAVAQGNIVVVADNSDIYAKVVKDHIDTYFVPNPRKGSDYILEKDMVENVLSTKGNYVRLGSGRWTYRSNVDLSLDYKKVNTVKRADYALGERYDYIDVKMSQSSAVYAKLSNNVLELNFANTVHLPEVSNVNHGLVSSIKKATSKGRSAYYIRFNQFKDFHGYYVEKTEDGARLYLKKAVKANDSDQPLSGISILIDPGHGGEDPGAIGVLGLAFTEEDINLANAFKLEQELKALGATVHLTRRSDVTLSLYDRLRISLDQKPDMFISMHADSIGQNVNISKVRGFSVHYKQDIAKALAHTVSDSVITNLNRYNRGIRNNNFYVVRGTWTPSILIEAGFVPNAYEFEWMTDDFQQSLLAKYLAKGIVDYFKR